MMSSFVYSGSVVTNSFWWSVYCFRLRRSSWMKIDFYPPALSCRITQVLCFSFICIICLTEILCRKFVFSQYRLLWPLMWVCGHRSSSPLLLAVLNQGGIYILLADLFSSTRMERHRWNVCVPLASLLDGKATEMRKESRGLVLVACIFLGTGTFISAVPFQQGRKWGVIGEKKESGGWKAFYGCSWDRQWCQKLSNRSTVTLWKSSVYDVMLTDQGRIWLCHLYAVFRIWSYETSSWLLCCCFGLM